MVKLLLITFSLLVSVTASAAHWNDQQIKKILVHDNGSSEYAGVVHVYMMIPLPDNAVPSCITSDSYKYDFAIDLSRGAAQAQYSTILAASISGKNISVSVNSSCIEGIPAIRNVIISNES